MKNMVLAGKYVNFRIFFFLLFWLFLLSLFFSFSFYFYFYIKQIKNLHPFLSSSPPSPHKILFPQQGSRQQGSRRTTTLPPPRQEGSTAPLPDAACCCCQTPVLLPPTPLLLPPIRRCMLLPLLLLLLPHAASSTDACLFLLPTWVVAVILLNVGKFFVDYSFGSRVIFHSYIDLLIEYFLFYLELSSTNEVWMKLVVVLED